MWTRWPVHSPNEEAPRQAASPTAKQTGAEDPAENDLGVPNPSEGSLPALERPSVTRGRHWPLGSLL